MGCAAPQVSQAESAARAAGVASALQDMVEKVTVLRYAVEQGTAGRDGAGAGGAKPEAALVTAYADLLANQGVLDVAARYAASVAEESTGVPLPRARRGTPAAHLRLGAHVPAPRSQGASRSHFQRAAALHGK